MELKQENTNLAYQNISENVSLLLNKYEFWDFSSEYGRMRAFSWTNNHFAWQVEALSNSYIDQIKKNSNERIKILNKFDKKIINDDIEKTLSSAIETEELLKERIQIHKKTLKEISQELNKNRNNSRDYEGFHNRVKTFSEILLENFASTIKFNGELNKVNRMLEDKLDTLESKTITHFLKDKMDSAKQSVKRKIGRKI